MVDVERIVGKALLMHEEKLLVRDQYGFLHFSPDCEKEVRKLRELGFSSWELAGILIEMYNL